MSLIHLFFVFFYIGLFAIGGGLIAATFMKQALCDQYCLITAEKFYSMLAISESTPGPIGINIATYIGTELHGVVGGVVATFGEVLPSLIVIILISKFFSRYTEKLSIRTVFSALRPATTGMVLSILVNLFSMAIINISAMKSGGTFFEVVSIKSVTVYAVSLIVLFKTKLHPVVIILFGAVCGVLFF